MTGRSVFFLLLEASCCLHCAGPIPEERILRNHIPCSFEHENPRRLLYLIDPSDFATSAFLSRRYDAHRAACFSKGKALCPALIISLGGEENRNLFRCAFLVLALPWKSFFFFEGRNISWTKNISSSSSSVLSALNSTGIAEKCRIPRLFQAPSLNYDKNKTEK